MKTKLDPWEKETIPFLLLMQAIQHALKDQGSLLDDLSNAQSLIQEVLNEKGFPSADAANELLQQKGFAQAVAELRGQGQQGMLGPG